ncbi:hypothetical protein PCANC_27716 [Puccinia coronata f. sp. avenae]|uniref:Uncharacterized protein n=1 Tax=Puccinia coronata f. sp. avenae TaxID=200324 RepID=A0A2N5TRY7_9BASI|nr:hypothetical protein PCANC_27716 [Puccinia coronata f. sp. avenae]
MPLSPPPKTDKGRRNNQYCTTIENLPDDEDKDQQPFQHQQQIWHPTQNPFHKEQTQDPDEETPQPQYQPKHYQSTPYPSRPHFSQRQQGYRLQMGDNSFADIPSRGIKIIKNPTLIFDGNNFTAFLKRYERDAILFGPDKHAMAMQIGRFVKTEELKQELEAMDGYDNVNLKNASN